MAKIVRLIYHPEGGGCGLLNLQDTVIIPSSEETSHPRMALTRPGFGRWRTKTGWTVVAGENDKLDFEYPVGSPVAATIAAGYYATGTLMAAAVDTALSAVTPGAWTVTYSAVTDDKFTIQQTAGGPDQFVLLFATGVNFAKSIHLDLGFTSTDKASAASVTAENVSFQSRHVLNFDFGGAQAFTTAIVRGHNLSAAGTVVLHADAATLVGVGWNDIATPDFVQALAGTADPRVVFFAAQSKQHGRLVFDDIANPEGYLEVAIAFLGEYVEPTRLQNIGRVRDPEHLSEIIPAIGGAHQQLRRAVRNVWSLTWKLFSQAEEDLWDEINEALRLGGSFFLTFDSAGAPTTSTIYGYFARAPRFDYGSGEVRTVSLTFAEAL